MQEKKKKVLAQFSACAVLGLVFLLWGMCRFIRVVFALCSDRQRHLCENLALNTHHRITDIWLYQGKYSGDNVCGHSKAVVRCLKGIPLGILWIWRVFLFYHIKFCLTLKHLESSKDWWNYNEGKKQLWEIMGVFPPWSALVSKGSSALFPATAWPLFWKVF